MTRLENGHSNMDVFLFYIGFVVNICCLGLPQSILDFILQITMKLEPSFCGLIQ